MIENFTKFSKKMGDKVEENPAARSTTVFLPFSKNRRGEGVQTPHSKAKVKSYGDLP